MNSFNMWYKNGIHDYPEYVENLNVNHIQEKYIEFNKKPIQKPTPVPNLSSW